MYLDTIPEITTLLKDKLEMPMSMKPMLLTMRRSIIDQHPAIAQFLCAAHDKGYLERI